MLNFKKAMLTGGGGFLAGRLAEKLVLEHKLGVHALVRNMSRAVRLARFPVKLFHGNIADKHAIELATDGCDVIFHCAHDLVNPQANLEAIRLLTIMLQLYSSQAAASTAKAERLIGYRPRVDFQKGIALTAKYIEWAKLKDALE